MGVLSLTTFCWEHARAFTLSVFLPGAPRLRRSAGHTTIYVFDMCLLENQRYINIHIDNNDNKNSNNNDNDNYNDNEIMI